LYVGWFGIELLLRLGVFQFIYRLLQAKRECPACSLPPLNLAVIEKVAASRADAYEQGLLIFTFISAITAVCTPAARGLGLKGAEVSQRHINNCVHN
jgi:hypothetical protein